MESSGRGRDDAAEPVPAADQYSVSSSAVSFTSLASESPQRYTEDSEKEGRSYRPRSASIFSSANSDGAFPDLEKHEHPLVATTSQLNREVQEAQIGDERNAQEPFSDPAYWKRKLRELWTLLKPDFVLDHLDYKSFKIVSRTWLMVFICTTLTVIGPVDRYFGAASYLLSITAVLQVAGGASMAHAFYTGIVDVIFVLFAFLVNVISHAISWRIRGYPTQEGLMQQLVEQGICRAGDANCYLHEVHKGRYLNTKATVIFLIGMMFTMIVSGYFQAVNRAFGFSWCFAVICCNITGFYLLMSPDFNPWKYGRLVILPIGVAMALRFFLAMVWFPVTSNFKFFNVVIGVMESSHSILATSVAKLKESSPMDADFPKLVDELETKVSGTLNRFALIKLEGLFVRGEICFSRLDPGNLGELRSRTRMMLNSMSGINVFFQQIVEKRQLISEHVEYDCDSSCESKNNSKEDIHNNSRDLKSDAPAPTAKEPSQESSEAHSKHHHHHHLSHNGPHLSLRRAETMSAKYTPSWAHKAKWLKKSLSKSYAHAGNFEENQFFLAEELSWDGMRPADLEHLHNNIVVHYSTLSSANQTLMAEIVAWAKEVNHFRIKAFISPSFRRKCVAIQAERNTRLQEAVSNLKEELYGDQRQNYLDWVKTYCDPQSVRSRQHYVYALQMDAIYGCTLERFAKCTLQLASYCLLLDESRPKACFIFPFTKSMSRSPRIESEYSSNDISTADGQAQLDSSTENVSRVQRRSPDSSPPRTVFHLAGIRVEKLWAALNDPTLLFCAKRAIFTILSGFLFVCRPTIYFAYSQRAIWVPIMTALTVSYQAVDGIYGFIVKLAMTFCGSVAGMVIWYMGDGHGSGNSYGFTAATALVMVFMLYFRHFNKFAVPMGAIVVCVTTILVSGMSWGNLHVGMPDSDVGYGFSVAWRRFVLVSIGLAIAFIGTILPQPVTAKKKVRVILGKSLGEIGDIQAGISSFVLSRANDPQIHIVPRTDPIVKKLRGVKQNVRSAQLLVALINYEPPLGGVWPKNRYELLMKLMRETVCLLEDIYYFADCLEDKKDMRAILQRAGWSSVELSSALYAVIMLGSRALTTGEALPTVTPGHLSEIYSRLVEAFLDFDASSSKKELEGLMEDRYITTDGRITLALISTVSSFYKHLDICLLLIKGLVGEIYAVDPSMLDTDVEKAPLMLSHFSEQL